MVLMGLGLGGNMQPMITAVQNAVSPREIGIATSSVTFFRSMGGTLGTAVFLSVLFNVLPGNISASTRRPAPRPSSRPRSPRTPTRPRSCSGDRRRGPGRHVVPRPAVRRRLAPVQGRLLQRHHVVFLIAFFVMIIGLVVVFFLPELPLCQRSAQQQRADELAAEADAAGPAAPPMSVTAGSGGEAPAGHI